jgi:tetratricopeptide (TPR) repeat protein
VLSWGPLLTLSIYKAALGELDAVLRLNPKNGAVHYVRGQVFKQLGRTSEAQEKMKTATRIAREFLDKRPRELEAGPAAEAEITQETQ